MASPIQLLYSGTSITDCPSTSREHGSHLWVLECVFIMWINCGSFAVITARPQVKLPHRGSNDQQILALSFCFRQWVVHLVMSSSAMGDAVWVVASIKSCASTGSDSAWLNRVVWGHWLVDPRWIAPKPWTTSQWSKVTYSCTVSLSSTTLPAKGWRSRLLSRLSFSPNIAGPLHRQSLGESVVAIHLGMTIHPEGRHFC